MTLRVLSSVWCNPSCSAPRRDSSLLASCLPGVGSSAGFVHAGLSSASDGGALPARASEGRGPHRLLVKDQDLPPHVYICGDAILHHRFDHSFRLFRPGRALPGSTPSPISGCQDGLLLTAGPAQRTITPFTDACWQENCQVRCALGDSVRRRPHHLGDSPLVAVPLTGIHELGKNVLPQLQNTGTV